MWRETLPGTLHSSLFPPEVVWAGFAEMSAADDVELTDGVRFLRMRSKGAGKWEVVSFRSPWAGDYMHPVFSPGAVWEGVPNAHPTRRGSPSTEDVPMV
ncbi:MAG: hypothetical protein BLITH_0742 [Brockia lithotrophica]|uniref:Uncharacterized protein n=1 Tax=Brockia lithotrophica TaxID=933949 RepID=A0A2T5G8P8_9BACL|nr:hypothetical protein [Brockia lithotrophica]PTQ52563.1 MAG: hypothetical protein BLITH_0742 [Brockia lithotrophica]